MHIVQIAENLINQQIKVGKIKKTWKTPWKTCKTPSKSVQLSTFPRFWGVEKWVKTWEIIQLSKMKGVEF